MLLATTELFFFSSFFSWLLPCPTKDQIYRVYKVFANPNNRKVHDLEVKEKGRRLCFFIFHIYFWNIFCGTSLWSKLVYWLLNLIGSGSFVIVVLPLKSGRICFGGTLVYALFSCSSTIWKNYSSNYASLFSCICVFCVCFFHCFIYASCMVVCNVRWPNFPKQIGLLFGLRTMLNPNLENCSWSFKSNSFFFFF